MLSVFSIILFFVSLATVFFFIYRKRLQPGVAGWLILTTGACLFFLGNPEIIKHFSAKTPMGEISFETVQKMKAVSVEVEKTVPILWDAIINLNEVTSFAVAHVGRPGSEDLESRLPEFRDKLKSNLERLELSQSQIRHSLRDLDISIKHGVSMKILDRARTVAERKGIRWNEFKIKSEFERTPKPVNSANLRTLLISNGVYDPSLEEDFEEYEKVLKR